MYHFYQLHHLLLTMHSRKESIKIVAAQVVIHYVDFHVLVSGLQFIYKLGLN